MRSMPSVPQSLMFKRRHINTCALSETKRREKNATRGDMMCAGLRSGDAGQAHELGAGQVVEGELVGEELADLEKTLGKSGFDFERLHLD